MAKLYLRAKSTRNEGGCGYINSVILSWSRGWLRFGWDEAGMWFGCKKQGEVSEDGLGEECLERTN